MTREQKIEWLRKADNSEVLYQIRWATERRQASMNIKAEIEASEDFQLALEEALRRMK